MATIIDQFVVKYTLDTKDLDKGVNATEKKLGNLKRESKEAGTAMGDSIEAGTKRATGSLGVLGSMLGKGGVIGLAIGSLAYIASKVDDKMFSVAQSLRKLGIDSKNLGIAASGMRNLQNMSELAGGSIDDATQDVGNLSKSLFNLKFNGQVSESLVMLSRLGVQFTDSYGRAREFGDVMLDTAAAIEKAKSAGRMTDAEGYQFALQAGFSGGDANLVNSGVANYQAALAKQQARRQVQGKDIAGGTRAVNASISLGQATVAGVGNAAMSAYGNTRGAAQEGIESAGGYVKDALSDFGAAVENAANSLRKSFSGSSFMTPGTGGRAGMGRSGMTRGLRNNNPLNLKALKGQAADKDGFAIFNTMDEGIRAADRQLKLNESRGIDTVSEQVNRWAPASDNNDVGAYMKSIEKQTGLKPGSGTADSHAALIAAMAKHESGLYGAPDVRSVQSALAMGSSAGGRSVSLQTGNVTIVTQATDANGIAGSFVDMTKRKLTAAHAETGVM